MPVVTLEGTGTEGYYEVTAQGAVAAYGDANNLGGRFFRLRHFG